MREKLLVFSNNPGPSRYYLSCSSPDKEGRCYCILQDGYRVQLEESVPAMAHPANAAEYLEALAYIGSTIQWISGRINQDDYVTHLTEEDLRDARVVREELMNSLEEL